MAEEDPFNPTTPEGIRARLVSLNDKLTARKGIPQFASNCEAIEAEIAKLEAALAELEPSEEPETPPE